MAQKGGGTPGTRRRLSDLGLTVSEVLESHADAGAGLVSSS